MLKIIEIENIKGIAHKRFALEIFTKQTKSFACSKWFWKKFVCFGFQ